MKTTIKFADKLTPWIISKFWLMVCKKGPEDCWNYVGGVADNGYGVFTIDGQSIAAHRLAYTILNGEIPGNLLIRHKCVDNKICCNPAHLIIGTHLDNNRDTVAQDRMERGSKRHSAKLREEDIPVIRNMLREGLSCREIGKTYGVSGTAIYHIREGKRWRRN